MTSAPEKRVAVSSLPSRQLETLAAQIKDPEQRKRVTEYLEQREREAAAKRKKRRRTSKDSRRKNRGNR